MLILLSLLEGISYPIIKFALTLLAFKYQYVLGLPDTAGAFNIKLTDLG